MQGNVLVWGLRGESAGLTLYSSSRGKMMTFLFLFLNLTDFDVALRYQSVDASVADTQTIEVWIKIWS